MNILSEKKLPAYDDFFEILNLTSDILENEDECYRPKNDDAEAGGLVDFQNEEKLTVVVPDLHARTFFLQNILNAKIHDLLEEDDYKVFEEKNNQIKKKNLTVFEALEVDVLNLVFVGDILHSERNKNRWMKIEQEFAENEYTGKNICAEMGEGLSLFYALCLLKVSFTKNVQILKGNHENILNETGGGDYAFKKYAEEGEMCRIFIQCYYGDDILYLMHCVEKGLPVVFVAKNVVVSHAEPESLFTKNKIINAAKCANVMEGLTWTANGNAQEGSVNFMIENLIGKDCKDAVYLAGHRPVKQNYDLRQNGKFIQIHNPSKQNVAVVMTGICFNPECNIKTVD